MKTRILLLLVGIAVGAYAGGFLSSETITYYNQTSTMASFSPYTPFDESDISEAIAFVPAVDQSGEGVTTMLNVHVVPGTRKALVDIEKLLFWTDTQNSIRVSRSVAENVTGEDLSYYDITYSIDANASVIEGPSAGAAMTIATISALTDVVADKTVMITGTINHDGTIGPVGEILAKAIAAKESGTRTFLVPAGQSQQTVYENSEHCIGDGTRRVCSIERIPGKVDVGEEAGLEVVEVRTIQDAMGYFFK